MATASFIADEAKRERGDQGHDEDVGEGKKHVEESSWSKTHERNKAECELNSSESKDQEDVGHKLLPQTHRLEGGREHKDRSQASKSTCHPENDHYKEEKSVSNSSIESNFERAFEQKRVKSPNA